MGKEEFIYIYLVVLSLGLNIWEVFWLLEIFFFMNLYDKVSDYFISINLICFFFNIMSYRIIMSIYMYIVFLVLMIGFYCIVGFLLSFMINL